MAILYGGVEVEAPSWCAPEDAFVVERKVNGEERVRRIAGTPRRSDGLLCRALVRTREAEAKGLIGPTPWERGAKP